MLGRSIEYSYSKESPNKKTVGERIWAGKFVFFLNVGMIGKETREVEYLSNNREGGCCFG